MSEGTGRNQPATASLSAGLDGLHTTTNLALADAPQDSVRFVKDAPSPTASNQNNLQDNHKNNHQSNSQNNLQDQKTKRIISFLSIIRQLSGRDVHFDIETSNNFPTGAGLASSASGFAALTLAANQLLELGLSGKELSRLARMGSGSAARSIFGGFVEMHLDPNAFASPLASAESWPLEVVIAVTSEAEKQKGSTQAMQLSRDTSPCYPAWVETHAADIRSAKNAIARRDFEQLAEVAEASCLKMHATIMTSLPPTLYWNPGTLAVMQRVVQLRQAGTAAFFTVDAGPQVKVFCEPSQGAQVEAALAETPGVLRTLATKVGGEPQVRFMP